MIARLGILCAIFVLSACGGADVEVSPSSDPLPTTGGPPLEPCENGDGLQCSLDCVKFKGRVCDPATRKWKCGEFEVEECRCTGVRELCKRDCADPSDPLVVPVCETQGAPWVCPEGTVPCPAH